MRVLMAGGSGDSGSRLVPHFVAAGHEVVITSRQSWQQVQVTGPDKGYDTVTWLQVDPLARPEEFIDRVRAAGPYDVVYNFLAAFIRGDPSAVIIEGTRQLLTAVGRREHPPRLVICSTTTVYGHRPGEVLSEASPPQGDLAIGRVQTQGETLVTTAAQAGYVEPLILRLPHIYGPGRSRLVDLISRGEGLVLGDGTNPMHHLYVEDFTAVLQRAAQPDAPPGVYNIVEDKAEPYGAFCDFVADWHGVPRPPRISHQEAISTGLVGRLLGSHLASGEALAELYTYMTSHAVLDNTAMHDRLGFSLAYATYREGLTDMFTRDGRPDRRHE